MLLSCGGLTTPCQTRVYCRVCDLVLDQVPAKQHFLGRRHEQACLDQCDQHFVCFECGTWCTSHHNLHQHLDGYSHRLRMAWLGRCVTPGPPCACGHDTPMRPASPAPSNNGRTTSPGPGQISEAAPAAPAAQPRPTPEPLVQQEDCTVGATLRCRICDWAGSKHAAWYHFKSAAHRQAAVQPPATPYSRVACGDCGVWCPDVRNLVQQHYPSARHLQRTRWLDGPPPPSAASDAAPGRDAPILISLPTMLTAQPPPARRSDEEGSPRPITNHCTASGPEILAELEQQLLCPISHEVVIDPVTIADGSSYERGSIQRWFAEHNTSPVTGLTVDTRVVVPNSMMRAVAAMYRRQRGSPST